MPFNLMQTNTNVRSFNPLLSQQPEFNPNMQFSTFSQLNQNFIPLNISGNHSANNSKLNDSRNHPINMSNSRDLNTSNSINNNSTNKSKSKSGGKSNKNYQVQINDDIVLIERIEGVLNNITSNHNKFCPYSSRLIDIKKCNFQNISAFFSSTSKKYYLTYFDSYLKANSNPNGPKILSIVDIPEAKINPNLSQLSTVDPSQYLRSDRKAYFVTIEGYHIISTYLLFKIEKLCFGLEHANNRNQLIYLNLCQKSTSLFEPSSFTVPYSEFRLVMTIHSTHSSEEPFTFECIMDFSQTKVTSESKAKFAEAFYMEGNNNIVCGVKMTFDPNAELANTLNYKMNLDTSFSNGSSSPSVKPDFGKNVFLTFQHFVFTLPFKRVEKKLKEIANSMTSLDGDISKNQSQKKAHSKLTLNPNAPLFAGQSGSNTTTNASTSQQDQSVIQNQQGMFTP